MTRLTALFMGSLLALPAMIGCDQKAEAKVQVEKLPDIKPSLPGVPTLPPDPHPIQYGDQSYSVFGMRRAMRKTINTDLEVTAFIAKLYVPPECPPKEKCPLPPAPHVWLADVANETDETKYLILAGYAENQAMIDEAIENASRGKVEAPPEDTGLLPIPTDFFPGAKIKVKGRFAYVSGSGFQSSEGVLGYAGHETLQPAPGQEPAE